MKKLNKNEIIAVCVALAVVSLLFILNSQMFSPFQSLLSRGEVSLSEDQILKIENGELIVQDIVVGEGPQAVSGDVVAVHYVGQFVDGVVFDSSLEGETPFVFELGSGQVIPGYEQGIPGMRIGGTRMLIIPPELAYGDRGIGPVPPDSTLIFEVTLVGILGKE